MPWLRLQPECKTRDRSPTNVPAQVWFGATKCRARVPLMRGASVVGERPTAARGTSRPALRAFAQALVVVARNAFGLGNFLILDGRLQHHAVGKVVDELALDLLPGRLMGGILITAMALQIGPAAIVFLLRDQDIGAALVEIDAHPVAGLEDRQPTAGCRLRRGVEN